MGAELDAWNALHQTAIEAGGTDKFAFSDDVAKNLAGLCIHMAHGMDQVLKGIEAMVALPNFSTTPSGHTLAQKFIDAANDLRDRVIPEHKNVLTAMGETFYAARNIVDNAERQSVDSFKALQNDVYNSYNAPADPDVSTSYEPVTLERFSGWDTSEDKSTLSPGGKGLYIGDDGGIDRVLYTPEYLDKLDGLQELKDLQNEVKGDRDAKDINVEHGHQLTWNELHANYGHMGFWSDAVLSAATDWKNFAGVLKFESDKFAQDFKREFEKGEFQGDGARSAIAKAREYGSQVTELINALTAISDNLRFCSSWMYKLHWYLPEVDAETFLKNHDVSYFDIEYDSDCTKWDEWYVVGATAASNSVPLLPSIDGSKSPMAPATTPVKPTVDDPNPDDGKQQPGGTPGGNLGTPGGNPGSPTVPETKQPDDKKPDDKQPTNPTDKQPTNTQNTDLSTLASTLSTIAQQGVSMVETLAQDGSSLVQSLLSSQQSTTTTTAQQELQQLQQQLSAPTPSPVTPSEPTSPGGSPASPGGPNSTPKQDNPQSKLFPRAGVPSTATEENKEAIASSSRAGLATTSSSSGSGMSGMPMSGAGASGAGQGGGKEHKRPDYLKSAENFAEALGVLPEAVTPVADVEK